MLDCQNININIKFLIKNDYNSLQYIILVFYKIIKLAIKNYGYILQYEPKLSVKNTYIQPILLTEKMTNEIIKLAIQNNCEHLVLQYVRFSENTIEYEIIKLAIRNNCVHQALRFFRLSKEQMTYIRNNNFWSNKIIKKNSDNQTLQYILIERLSIEIIKLAIKKNSDHRTLQYILIEKMTDEIIKLAVQNNYKALQYVPIEKISIEICKLAVQNNCKALQYVPIEKLSDEIIKLAVRNNSKALRYVPIDKMSIEIIKLALKNNGYVIIHVPIEKMSEEIIKLALENNSYILLHIPESKITDDIINFVIEKDGYNYNILQYLPIEKMPSDPITFEPIHKDRAILIHKQLYDAKSLSKYIELNINATIPHNRKPFTKKMLQNIYNKSNYV